MRRKLEELHINDWYHCLNLAKREITQGILPLSDDAKSLKKVINLASEKQSKRMDRIFKDLCLEIAIHITDLLNRIDIDRPQLSTLKKLSSEAREDFILLTKKNEVPDKVSRNLARIRRVSLNIKWASGPNISQMVAYILANLCSILEKEESLPRALDTYFRLHTLIASIKASLADKALTSKEWESQRVAIKKAFCLKLLQLMSEKKVWFPEKEEGI